MIPGRALSTERQALKVLVIDDSDLAREHLRGILSGAGMEVFELPSAIGATREVMRNGIDAAVIDISLPGLSGDRLVGLLRSNRKLAHLVIVVVSARTTDELAGLNVGADAVIPKENAARELTGTLRALHSQVASSRAAAERGSDA